MSNDDRADRIAKDRQDRKRGRRSRSQKSQTSKEPQTKQTKQTPVTERHHSTFYLTEEMHTMLRQVQQMAVAEYDIEYGFELEKNRHIRPLMLYLGAQQLQEMDATEVAELLDNTDILDSTDVTGSTDE